MDKRKYARDTYILEFVKDNTKFICNRNSSDFDRIFEDKYIKFWEIDEIYELSLSDCKYCNILAVLEGMHNYNKCHQKQINEIKKKYINGHIEADVKLANIQLAYTIKSYRIFYMKQYDLFFDKMNCIHNIEDKLYEMAKKLFYKNNNIEYLCKSKWNIWNDERLSYEQRILIMILKNYIYKLKKNQRCRYPFAKGVIKDTIKYLIKENNI